MIFLWVVTFIWAFSYNIIGEYISPFVDPYLAVLIRSAIGLLVFLPFLFFKPRAVIQGKQLAIHLMIIGLFQFGITYVLLYKSYLYITVTEIMLFTITTPIFVTLIDNLLQKKMHLFGLLSAVLAIIGAFIIRYNQVTDQFITGFLLLQLANLCFAFGQVYYKYLSKRIPHQSYQYFGYFFIGACVFNLIAFCLFGNLDKTPSVSFGNLTFYQGIDIPSSTWYALLFVGFIATGVGQYLWCIGAKKVSGANLAVMNNAVIPIGIVINLFFYQKDIDIIKLLIGSSVMFMALWINFYFKDS